MKKTVSRHLEAIRENAIDCIAQDELVAKLEQSLAKKKPLKLKIGFDPTARDIHLGHTVLLRKLRKLQDLGHRVSLIIGDFTAKIGDPSGRSVLRPVLTDREIKSNASTYTDQAFRILDKRKTTVIYNSIWYKAMKPSQFLSLLSSYTVARMLERDDFSLRMKENRPLTILELVYPLIQGYDSVKMEADIEFGGSDQKFNLIVGRHLQEIAGQKPQAIVTMPLLVGLDGSNKMSKSLGNYIGITDSAKDMFGKIMSVSDEVMWEYFRLLTEHSLDEVKKMHPKEAKLLLAETIVSDYYCAARGKKEHVEFDRVFSQRELPTDMPVYTATGITVDVIAAIHAAGLVPSKNEVRRLLAQESISAIDSKEPSRATVLRDAAITVPAHGIVLKVGKKKFLKIVAA